MASLSLAAWYPDAPKLVHGLSNNVLMVWAAAKVHVRRIHSRDTALHESNRTKSAIIRPADACDFRRRQCRFFGLVAAYRLAAAAISPLATNVVASREQKPNHRVNKRDDGCRKPQNQLDYVHRRITSLLGRRHCLLAGPTPLTCSNYMILSTQYQTFVRIPLKNLNACVALNTTGAIAHTDRAPYETPRERLHRRRTQNRQFLHEQRQPRHPSAQRTRPHILEYG